MKFIVDCECGAKLRARSEDAGRRGICPYCGQSVSLIPPDEEVIVAEVVAEDPQRYAQPVREYLDPPIQATIAQSPFAEAKSQPVSRKIESDHAASETPPASKEMESPPASAASETPTGDSPSEQPTDDRPPWLERALNNLLSPRSLRWMFVIGGGLMTLGLIIWLVSLGVFEDPRLVAGILTGGSFAVYGIGMALSLRNRKSMVGQAVTFLGCVLLPLNLWYYHAQGLITLDGPLWIAAAGCCLVYIVTVVVLRDPVFLYAVQAGVTLTALLLLGNLGLIADGPALCFLFLALAAISIHAERLFALRGDELKGFGLPVFWCGHLQLGAALIVLLIVQPLGWLGGVDQQIGQWPWANNFLTQHPFIVAAIWLGAAYLYGYSDLVVRKIGVYVFGAAFCLLMGEITLAVAADVLMEWRLVLLSVSALGLAGVFYLLGKTNDFANRFLPPAVLLLSVPPLIIGIILHVRATTLSGLLEYDTGWEFLVAMLVSAACARICAGLFSRTHFTSSSIFLFLSAGGLLAAYAGLLRVIGITGWNEQAPLLMLAPIGYIIAAAVERGRWNEQPLGWIAHLSAAFILLGTLLAAMLNLGYRLDEFDFELFHGGMTNLLFAATFALGFVFYEAAAYIRRRSVNVAFAAICGAAALWQLLVFFQAPLEILGPLLALLGLATVFGARFWGLERSTRFDAMGNEMTVIVGPGRIAHLVGHGLLLTAWVVAWLANVAAYMQAADAVIWMPIVSLFLCVAVAVIADFAASGFVWRHLHAVAAAVLALTGAFLIYLQLDLNPWQVLEYTSVIIGVIVLVASFIAILFEDDDEPSDNVTVGLLVGSLCSAGPFLISVLYYRYVQGEIFLPDEFGLVTTGVAMLVIGIVLQARWPVAVGGVAVVSYAAMLLISLFYLPQLTMGVYLAIGGGLLFGSAVLLSVFRERLIAMPGRFARREGAFQWLRWR